MSRLIRLPNGSWVDPVCVLAVIAIDDTELTLGGFVGPRVVLHLRADWWIIECPSFEKACEMRDRIAAEVNGGQGT